ncbi:MAG: hypothetical protein HC896_13995 [Bacteroidales bacterium]|nr:hypothetical protein [Bacteroidales bacterium]
MHTKFYLLLLLAICLNSTVKVTGQANLLVSNTNGPEPTLWVKCISENIVFDEGIFVYRRKLPSGQWEKLNQAPLMKGQAKPSPEELANDSTLQSFIEVANEVTSVTLEGIVKAMMLAKIVQGKALAAYLGIFTKTKM